MEAVAGGLGERAQAAEHLAGRRRGRLDLDADDPAAGLEDQVDLFVGVGAEVREVSGARVPARLLGYLAEASTAGRSRRASATVSDSLRLSTRKTYHPVDDIRP